MGLALNVLKRASALWCIRLPVFFLLLFFVMALNEQGHIVLPDPVSTIMFYGPICAAGLGYDTALMDWEGASIWLVRFSFLNMVAFALVSGFAADPAQSGGDGFKLAYVFGWLIVGAYTFALSFVGRMAGTWIKRNG